MSDVPVSAPGQLLHRVRCACGALFHTASPLIRRCPACEIIACQAGK